LRTIFSILTALVLVAGLPATDAAAAAQSLRMGGTGSSIGMLRQVGGAFAARAGAGVKIEVVPSLGSSGAIHALADGKLDIAVSARPLKPAEAAQGLHQVLVLRTAYVLATSQRNPNELKTADLPKIFAASKPTWADGTPIRLILRPRSETDTKLLGELFPGMDKAIGDLRRRAEVPIAATDQDNADMAERLPGSLTGTTLTQLMTEHRHLNVVTLDGVVPTLANFESGSYRFVKNLYFIVRPNDAPVAQEFIAFLNSLQGEKALRETGTLPGAE
jgi:phosphate transport system substrate-binding protein